MPLCIPLANFASPPLRSDKEAGKQCETLMVSFGFCFSDIARISADGAPLGKRKKEKEGGFLDCGGLKGML